MKRIMLFVLLMGYALIGSGQQDPLSTQYVFNPYAVNPAYGGLSEDLTVWASYRTQWAGFDGAPETKSLSGHLALADNRMGIGLTFSHDKIGVDKNTQAVASYSYHIKLAQARKISFGLRAGFSNYSVDYDELQIDGSDFLFQENVNDVSPVIGSGLIYSSDHVFISVSVPNMLKTSISQNGTENVVHSQHAYALAAYAIQLTPRLKLKPFVMTRAVQGAAVNVDFGATLTTDDSFSIGILSRKLHTYGAMTRLNIGDVLRVGYIFELPTNKSVGVRYLTHEFTVGLRMNLWESHNPESANF